MVEFKSFEKDIEVNGQTIYSVIDGISIKFLIDSILTNAGLPSSENIVATDWYSQQKWLDAFKVISEKVGRSSLYNIGQKIIDNAQFPPGIDNIEKGLESIDVAYHMNHRKEMKPLFNPENGEMFEGIGHYYIYERKEKEITLKCENPYPCEFDRGIIKSMSKKFANFPRVKHDDTKECRKNGGDFCFYTVSWD